MKLLGSITGFYYIGSARENISKFVNIYKRGYASGNLKQAMTELLLEKHLIPEVICCESSFGLAAIRQLSKLLSGHKLLSKVPFIIDSKNMTAFDCHPFIENYVADELLNLAEWDEKNLETKINFLKKIKTHLQKTVKRESDQEMFQKQGFLDSLLKRGFDIIVASSAIIFLSPLFLLIAIAIRYESKGNILYISKRAGMGYRIFNFYKFRTMVADAEGHRIEFAHLNLYHNNAFFKINNDPRITRVGHLLRNTSLDELPQLFNVLLGDMSLVGNRPLPLYEAKNLTTDALATRFMAPAGITGLWQIKKRGKAELSVDERMELDIDYVNKSNFFYDLWIMANTPQALMQKVNT